MAIIVVLQKARNSVSNISAVIVLSTQGLIRVINERPKYAGATGRNPTQHLD